MMKITVKVKTKAKEYRVEQVSDNAYLVCVKEEPIEGKANMGTIKALSEYFNVPKSAISIIGGENYKEKVIEIKERI